MFRSLLMLSAVLLVPGAVFAEQATFQIRDTGASRIQFVSDAPLETITGVTSHLSGQVSGDPNDLSAVKGEVSAKIATIKTGIDLRDEHLRSDNWLDAKRFPEAKLVITKVQGAKALKAGKPQKLKIHGQFTLHGVTHDVVVDTQVHWMPLTDEMKQAPGIDGDVLRIKGSFTVKLTDYKVSVPAIVRLKVSNEIEVNVQLTAIKTAAK